MTPAKLKRRKRDQLGHNQVAYASLRRTTQASTEVSCQKKLTPKMKVSRMKFCVGCSSVPCLCCCGFTVVLFAEGPVVANPEEAERAMRQVQKLQAGGALDSWEEVPTIVGDIPATGRAASSDTAAQDLSPPRRGRKNSPDLSPQRKRRREASPVAKRRHDSPDLSPVRRTRRDSPDASPPRRRARASSSPTPPPRQAQNSPDASPPRRKRSRSTGASPPRQSRHDGADTRTKGKSAKATSLAAAAFCTI